jgi:hypothetical protein
MRRVLYSLIPIMLFSLYLYGIRPLVILLVSIILGTATEYIMEKGRNKKVSEAVLVTSTLFALSLPPKTPLWVVAVGIVFAVFMGKEVYGGFGRKYLQSRYNRKIVYLYHVSQHTGSLLDGPGEIRFLCGCSECRNPARDYSRRKRFHSELVGSIPGI